jgi:hypothetical protein
LCRVKSFRRRRSIGGGLAAKADQAIGLNASPDALTRARTFTMNSNTRCFLQSTQRQRDRCVIEKKIQERFNNKLRHHLPFSFVWFHQIPFIQNNSPALPLFGSGHDAFVLRRYAHRKINNQHTEVGAANASLSASR